MGQDVADLTGEHRLAGKVRDFADNWDYNRGKLEEKLEFLRDALDAVIETMKRIDGARAVGREGRPGVDVVGRLDVVGGRG